MAEQIYKLLYDNHEVEIQGPEGATDDQLKAAAADYLKANAPKRKFPPAVVQHLPPPEAPAPVPAGLVENDPNASTPADDPALAALIARTDALTKTPPTYEDSRNPGTGNALVDYPTSTLNEMVLGALQGPYNAAAFITDPLLRPFVGSKAVEDARAGRKNFFDNASRAMIPHPSGAARMAGQMAGTLPVGALRAPAAVTAALPRLAPILTRAVQGTLFGAGIRDQGTNANSSAAGGALANAVLPPAVGATVRAVGGTKLAHDTAALAAPYLGRAGKAVGSALDDVYAKVAPWMGAEAPTTAAAAVTKPQEAYQLSQKYGVDLMPADVGGRFTKGLTAGTSQTLIGGPQVQGAAHTAQHQLGAAVNKVADDTGLVLEPVDAGNLGKQGAQEVIGQLRARGSRLYDRITGAVGDTKFPVPNALPVLDEEIAKAAAKNNPQDPVLKRLLQMRDQVAGDEVPDGLSYEGIRGVVSDAKAAHRTDDLRNTNAQRVFGRVSKALDRDITETLDATQPGLAAQYERANAFHRDRVDTIDNVFEPLVGKDASGESVVTKLNTMFQGNGKGGAMLAGRLLDELPSADARNLRATVIANLGKAKPSAQDETGGVFSSETFLSNWNKITLRGRKFLTNRDPELGKSLNELATLAARMRESNALANKSQTGRAVNVGRMAERIGGAGGALFGAHEAGATGSLLGVGGIAALEGLTGAALSSKPLVKLLVRAGSLRTPGAAENWARQLTSLGTRSPELRGDVAHILKAVMPGHPAAEPEAEAPAAPINPYADLDEDALKALAGEAAAAGGADVGGAAALPLDNPDLLPETRELAPRVLHQESGGDPNAVSPTGAEGLMQVMPHTGRDPGYGIEPLKDNSSAENARFGVDYLDAMLRNHGAHKVLGLMSYNWGPGAVDKWLKGGRHLSDVPMETRKYVNAILRDDVFPVDQ